MRIITLQKKLLGLFIIILGMGTYTKGMELSDYLHPTTDDTIYLDPVNAPVNGTGETPCGPARRLPAEAVGKPGSVILYKKDNTVRGAFEFDVNSFHHP